MREPGCFVGWVCGAKQECVCVCVPSVLLFFPTRSLHEEGSKDAAGAQGQENPGQPVNSLPLVAPQLVLTPQEGPGGEDEEEVEKVSWMLEHCC